MENITEEPKAIIPEKTPIEKLKEGIFLRYSETELDFPGYHAMRSIPTEMQSIQDQWRYASEILRVLSELELTLWVLENRIPSDEDTKDIPHNPEDFVIYYQGAFLELAHQLRDKILEFVALLLDVKGRKSKEGSESFINRLIVAAQTKNIPIIDELKAWSDTQPERTGLITAIAMRTSHHHHVSGLGAHSGFLDAKVSRAFGGPATQAMLTPYGKERMAAMGKEGFDSLLATAKKNGKATMEEIKSSVNALAEKLVAHFSLEVSPEKLAQFASKQEAFAQKIKVKNDCKIENIPTGLQRIPQDIQGLMAISGDSITSVYLTGSLPRGNFHPEFSDINFVFVVEKEEFKKAVEEPFLARNALFSTQVFTKKEFVDQENLLAKKYRFICKNDGILLAGQNLIGDERFPNPSGELAWILNHDFVQKIEEVESWIQTHKDASRSLIGRMSKKVAKLSVDIGFAVAMTNDPQYAHDRMTRIEIVNNTIPTNKVMMDTLKKILMSGGFGDMESLIGFTATTKETGMDALAQIEPLYTKLRKVSKAKDG